MENKKNSRPYRSRVRERQALETKERIAEVTDMLVKANGYENTTIGSIAEEAGVATQTVYAIFGSKRGIILHLIKKALKESTIGELSDEVLFERDSETFYDLIATEIKDKLVREHEVICSVGGFSMLYPELADLIKVAEGHRRRFIENGVNKIKGKRKVFEPDDPTVSLRLDLLWVLMDGHLYHGLVETMGWSTEELQNVIKQFMKFIFTDMTFKTTEK